MLSHQTELMEWYCVFVLGEMNSHLLCLEQMRNFVNQQQSLTRKFDDELATVANEFAFSV